MAKPPFDADLTPRERRLARSQHFLARNLPGSQQVRQLPDSHQAVEELVAWYRRQTKKTAFLLFRESIEAKVDTLIKGCGNNQIITMCLIYLLSGAFAVVTQAMGAVDSRAPLTLSI